MDIDIDTDASQMLYIHVQIDLDTEMDPTRYHPVHFHPEVCFVIGPGQDATERRVKALFCPFFFYSQWEKDQLLFTTSYRYVFVCYV